jgi:subtilisin family serine protease
MDVPNMEVEPAETQTAAWPLSAAVYASTTNKGPIARSRGRGDGPRPFRLLELGRLTVAHRHKAKETAMNFRRLATPSRFPSVLTHCSVALALVAVVLGGCSDKPVPAAPDGDRPFMHAQVSQQEAGRYLVLFAAERVPADFVARVERGGGAVEASLDDIGVAVVTGLTEAAAAELAAEEGVRAVEPDAVVTMSGGDAEAAEAVGEETPGEPFAPADATASPTAAAFYARQWNMRAVFADQAWAAGHLGSRDVVVAILDTGIDYLHPDLVGLVDLERSKSFVPREEQDVAAIFPGRLPFSDLFWHGTAAASIVASNAKVVGGVNRYVTLIAVKVARTSQDGLFGRLLAGIVYAADQGADVISVSRGHQIDKSESPGLVAAGERVMNYAFRKGALVVSLPFNDAADLDHNGDRVRLPCEGANVICTSATAPTDAASKEGPWTDVDARAPYSAFGRSAVDVAAPGGAGAGFPNLHTKVWLPCTTTWIATTGPEACRRPECRSLDVKTLVEKECLGRGIGTSWASPTVAGLAALLVAQLGHGNPALIRQRILESADDLGEPGTDPYYGKGRINIARALGVTR